MIFFLTEHGVVKKHKYRWGLAPLVSLHFDFRSRFLNKAHTFEIRVSDFRKRIFFEGLIFIKTDGIFRNKNELRYGLVI